MSVKHKWHKEIKAWADGAEIEHKHTYQDEWKSVTTPNWSQSLEFRIKPQPKEPQYLYLYWGNRNDQGYDYFVSPKVLPCYQLINKIKMEGDNE